LEKEGFELIFSKLSASKPGALHQEGLVAGSHKWPLWPTRAE
jgi:hypothetical protein